MRAAMARAEVGDDVYGEDPTVARLEERVAGLFGHEAALFTPTGSMANVLAVRSLVGAGQEVLCEASAHIARAELGAHAAYTGLTMRTWIHPRGQVDLPTIQTIFAPDMGPFFVPHRGDLGREHPQLRRRRGAPARRTCATCASTPPASASRVHMDGARIWNAHVATGVPLAEYGAVADVMAVCLSKGLGAPVGSLMVGSADAIAEARVWRKRMGGGMRQVGILAAAGLHALDHHVERLADDHAHARLLAEACGVDPATVDTNIVVVQRADAADVRRGARARPGVIVSHGRPDRRTPRHAPRRHPRRRREGRGGARRARWMRILSGRAPSARWTRDVACGGMTRFSRWCRRRPRRAAGRRRCPSRSRRSRRPTSDVGAGDPARTASPRRTRHPWSGYVETDGGARPARGGRLHRRRRAVRRRAPGCGRGGAAATTGGSTGCWSPGETDLVHQLGADDRVALRADSARLSRDPDIRLPRTADLVPPVLAERLLRDVDADERTPASPRRRVAGVDAPGLRLAPAAAQSSIDHVDLWADPDSGVPLRVEVFADGRVRARRSRQRVPRLLRRDAAASSDRLRRRRPGPRSSTTTCSTSPTPPTSTPRCARPTRSPAWPKSPSVRRRRRRLRRRASPS